MSLWTGSVKSSAERGKNTVTNMNWLPLRYGDFYDIPRTFIVDYKGDSYFFDCPFNDDLDDYPDFFTAYRLRSRVKQEDEIHSWADLAARGERVGIVQIKNVHFDQSKRKAVADSVFGFLVAN